MPVTVSSAGSAPASRANGRDTRTYSAAFLGSVVLIVLYTSWSVLVAALELPSRTREYSAVQRRGQRQARGSQCEVEKGGRGAARSQQGVTSGKREPVGSQCEVEKGGRGAARSQERGDRRQEGASVKSKKVDVVLQEARGGVTAGTGH
eukprot:364485-Chlamydomonas_euryale.AAC.1